MSALRRTLVRQFRQPSGTLGSLAGWVMANRPSNRERSLETLGLLDVRREDRVLEIGFGPGLAIAAAARLASDGVVVGVDHSEVMLRQASRRNALAIAAGRVSLQLGSAASLPPLSGRFDKAFAVNVHMFWEDPVAVLTGVLRVLKPQATLAVTHQPRHAGATAKDATRAGATITQHLRDAGFEDVRAHSIPLRPVAAVCVLGCASQPNR